MQMRTTLNLDEKLLTRAARLSGIREKTALLHAGLEALIARESARRLAALGGTERKLGPARRGGRARASGCDREPRSARGPRGRGAAPLGRPHRRAGHDRPATAAKSVGPLHAVEGAAALTALEKTR